MEKYKPENFRIEQTESIMSPDWAEKLKECPIDLLEKKPDFTQEELKEKYPGKIALVDAYIRGIEESGKMENNILHIDNILNIDHHAPIEEFEKNISSTNLAIEWVKKNGVLGKDYSVVINHTDCDSVLAALIVRGVLSPDDRFGEASVAADHTGKENEIADLLQGLEDRRDLEFSARNLKLLLDGKELEPDAQKLMKKRYAERSIVEEVIQNGGISTSGGVSFVEFDKRVDSAFFPALIPDAQVILVFCPHETNPNALEAKIRLGMAAPAGFTLYKLNIKDIDSGFGNRWNAGSNNRGIGTILTIEEYAQRLDEKLIEYKASKKK